MKVTVCELSSNWINDKEEQEALFSHTAKEKSDLLLLPEMPFYGWLAASEQPDTDQWQRAVAGHDRWIEQLDAFNAPIVAGTRPVIKEGIPLNEGFIWTRETGARGIHDKYYLPDEEGFWEATWYQRGNGEFKTVEINGLCIGFLICTELWFNHRARAYGQAGMDILVCPRATPRASASTWVAGGRAAANVSGAFCLSSNFNGPNTASMDFGGTGWIIEPEEAEVLGTTTRRHPFLTVDIDPELARSAKKTYPRYVKD